MCAAQHVSHLALAELLYAHNDLLVRTVPPSTSSPVTKSVSCWASNSVNTSVMHLFRNNPINTLCLQSLDFLPHITYTYGQSSVKLPVTRSLGHLVTWSYGHSVIRSLNHSVTWSLGHSVTWSLGHSVTRSLGHSVAWSLGHIITIFNMATDELTN